VLTITDDQGRPVRRMDLEGGEGLRRVAWNLRRDPAAQTDPADGTAGRGGQGGGRGGGRGGRGGNQGALVEPGRYRATLGRMSGDIVTPIGQPQSFGVVRIEQ
jgi:hypothetical protein